MIQLKRDVGIQGQWDAKELGQTRPSDTTAVSIYSPGTSIIVTNIQSIIIANSTGSAATYRIFLDQDGTTYDQSTAIAYDVSLAANSVDELQWEHIYMNDSDGNLAVRTGTGNALTFTVFGLEIVSTTF